MLKSVMILQKILNAALTRTVIPGIFCGRWIKQILSLYGALKVLPTFGNNFTPIDILFGFIISEFIDWQYHCNNLRFTSIYNIIQSHRLLEKETAFPEQTTPKKIAIIGSNSY